MKYVNNVESGFFFQTSKGNEGREITFGSSVQKVQKVESLIQKTQNFHCISYFKNQS